MKSGLRRVEGYKNGNVTFIFPEGDISRWDLFDWHGNRMLNRIPAKNDPVGHDRTSEFLGGLVQLGLISEGSWVAFKHSPLGTFEDDDCEIVVVNAITDEAEFFLRKSAR